MQDWIVILIRTAVLFILCLTLVKIIGTGSLSKITPFKLISYIIISVIMSLILLGLIPNIVLGFVALAVWISLFLSLDYLSIKSKWFHDFIIGKETVLIAKGKVLEENLLAVRYTGDELLRELRSKNAFNLADVEFAVMESTGEINVLLKSDKCPVTPHNLQKKVDPLSQPETVILDGNILDDALTSSGLNREWLNIQLSNSGVSLDNVFIGQVDSSGNLYIDLFDDMIQTAQSNVKEMLYANIAKCQADFLTFALETNNPQAKQMYSSNANKLKKLMDDLEPYLLR